MNSNESLSSPRCDHEGRPLRFWWWTSGIENIEDYDHALKHFEKLMNKNPPLFSPDGDMLEYWGKQISDFEDKYWPMDR